MKRILCLVMAVVMMCGLFCGCGESSSGNSDSALLSEVNGDIAVELVIKYGNAFHTNTVLTSVDESSVDTVKVNGYFDLNIPGKGSVGKSYFSGEYTKSSEDSYSKNYFEIDF